VGILPEGRREDHEVYNKCLKISIINYRGRVISLIRKILGGF